MSDTASALVPAVSPVCPPVRMFVAPVDRANGPVVFDPAHLGRFAADAPPAGWFALGSLAAFERDDTSEFSEVRTGAPAVITTRGRSGSAASLRCGFTAWSKLAMALSSGSQQMNLLRTATPFTAANSGGTPESAAVMGGSAADTLRVRADFVVSAGDRIVVDVDYAGETGYVGSPIVGAFLRDPERIHNDVHYVRRVSFNLGLVAAVALDTSASPAAQVVTLAEPLPAGIPAGQARMCVVLGFVDRVGGTYLSEWSVLLLAEGVAGDRVLLYYPRVEAAPGKTEERTGLAPGLERWRLQAELIALPVTDGNDGDAVLCYRSYLPAPGRT